LYGNSSYEGHDTIYNAFSRKEIDDINEGWASKSLTREKFNDIIQIKKDIIDRKTNLLIKEYLEETSTSDATDQISDNINDFQALGENDKEQLECLGDEMFAELSAENILSYREYKKLASACNFSAASMIDPRDVSIWTDIIWRILDDILEDEEFLNDLALIVLPITIVFIIYLWYRNLKNKKKKFL
jgi:hypothetical protein